MQCDGASLGTHTGECMSPALLVGAKDLVKHGDVRSTFAVGVGTLELAFVAVLKEYHLRRERKEAEGWCGEGGCWVGSRGKLAMGSCQGEEEVIAGYLERGGEESCR